MLRTQEKLKINEKILSVLKPIIFVSDSSLQIILSYLVTFSWQDNQLLYHGESFEPALSIGSGHNGSVVKYRSTVDDSKTMAVKFFKNNTQTQAILNEEKNWNIFYPGNKSYLHLDSQKEKYVFVMPVMGNISLPKWLTLHNPSNIKKLKFYISASEVIAELRQKRISHKDIWRGNFRVDSVTASAHVVDFGKAAQTSDVSNADEKSFYDMLYHEAKMLTPWKTDSLMIAHLCDRDFKKIQFPILVAGLKFKLASLSKNPLTKQQLLASVRATAKLQFYDPVLFNRVKQKAPTQKRVLSSQSRALR
jgi:hypothetical protein